MDSCHSQQPKPQVFEAEYAAKVSYAGDTVNSYKINNGLYLDLGGGEMPPH
jgi:hypothetical protein